MGKKNIAAAIVILLTPLFVVGAVTSWYGLIKYDSVTGIITFHKPVAVGTKGLRDNSGTLEFQDPAGDWGAVGSGGVTDYSELQNLPTLGTAAAADKGILAGNVPAVGSDGVLPIQGIDLPFLDDYKVNGQGLSNLVTPTWGNISGTLSDQTDLQALLNRFLGFSDDFSANTSENYTAEAADGILIGDGYARGADHSFHYLVHNTILASSNHFVEGFCEYVDGTNYSGLILRATYSDGVFVSLYNVSLESTSLAVLSREPDGVYIGSWTLSPTIMPGTLYKMRIQAVGATFNMWIDLNGDGDYADTGEAGTAKTDSTYLDGKQVGMKFVNEIARIDNLRGGI